MALATEQVPPYSSQFSKHTFTQPQLVALYCLKLSTTYRDLIDWLGEMPRIQRVLGLERLPHFTTVQKAFQCQPLLHPTDQAQAGGAQDHVAGGYKSAGGLRRSRHHPQA